MNFKKIVQYNKLREQLTVEEIALADALRDSSEADKALLVESLAPAKPVKRTRKPRGKSQRASGMAEQLNKSLSQQRAKPLCAICGNDEDYVDHSEPSPNYHAFDAGKSDARAAEQASSTSDAATSGTVSSGEQGASAGSVQGASAGGD